MRKIMKILIYSRYDSGYNFSIKSIDTISKKIKLIADRENYTYEQKELIYADINYMKKNFPNYELYIYCEDGDIDISTEKEKI